MLLGWEEGTSVTLEMLSSVLNVTHLAEVSDELNPLVTCLASTDGTFEQLFTEEGAPLKKFLPRFQYWVCQTNCKLCCLSGHQSLEELFRA